MGWDPALMAMTFHRGSEANWEKTAVCHGFVTYDLRLGEEKELEEESIPAAKLVRSGNGAPLSFCCLLRLYFFREGVDYTLLEDTRREYEKYRGQMERSVRPLVGRVMRDSLLTHYW